MTINQKIIKKTDRFEYKIVLNFCRGKIHHDEFKTNDLEKILQHICQAKGQ